MGHELSCMCFRVLVYIQNERDEQGDHFIICKTELAITIQIILYRSDLELSLRTFIELGAPIIHYNGSDQLKESLF